MKRIQDVAHFSSIPGLHFPRSVIRSLCSLLVVLLPAVVFAQQAEPPKLDLILEEAANSDCLVLQANFNSGTAPGPDDILEARIYGNIPLNSTPSTLSISPANGAGNIWLNGALLVSTTISPTLSGSSSYWQWSGTFVVTGSQTSNPRITIAGLKGGPATASLGDVWILQGGENVETEGGIDISASMRVRQAPKALAEGPNIFAVFSNTTAIPSKVTAPLLAANFAVDLFKTLTPSRPIAVYSVARSQSRYDEWHSEAFWPRFGAKEGRGSPTARGLIFWTGEWDAEYGGMPEWNFEQPSTEKWLKDLKDWQARQSQQQQDIVTGLSVRTSSALWDKAQTLLIIQLQDVNRQPSHLKIVNPDLESPWELLRAAQTDAVLKLREGGRKARLVPALHVENSPAATGNISPWFWSSTSARYTDLAKGLAFAAVAEVNGQTTSQVVVPVADWSSPSQVKISLPQEWGQKILVEQFTTNLPEGAPYWHANTNSTLVGSTLIVKDPDIKAIRYGGGDAPGSLSTTATNSVNVLPTFRFYRP